MRVYSLLLTFIAAVSAIAFVCVGTCSASVAGSVVLCRSIVRGAALYVIVVDLNDPGVMVDIGLPERGISHSEPFGSFVKRHAPIAAVTGTYFDTRTLIPTGSIVVGGKMVYENSVGNAVCFTQDNRVRFVDSKVGEACDLSGAECGIRTGPRLLANGEYALSPRREGFRHPGLFGARTRMALGVTAHNKLLLACVRTPVTFAKLASIMKMLGAVDAICLDGGTSSAMYYRGRIIQRPGRMLTNVVEIRDRPVPQIPVTGIADTGIAIRTLARLRAKQQITAPFPNAQDELPELSDHSAVLSEPVRLRLAKGVHALFPIHRA